MTDTTNTADVLDTRNLIARFEELETMRDDEDATFDDDDKQEMEGLAKLLNSMKGYGGDKQWRGDWYPIKLVRDDHFEEFAQEEAESLDLIKSDSRWPYTCIDWKQAAKELQQDYSSVEYDGITYWYR